ncbi:calcium/sodium antiporter [Candidatus Saccharibacteria bacterium]|nr:calcium/sodium antiporter [Candidatus Saccharibacteria bacterium]
MEVILQFLILIVGFVVLIKGADVFVDGASATAENFKVPKMMIGLTIVAFGTSAPEFAVSVKSILSGNTDMLLGNVIGSNVLNILLIIGLSAMIKPLIVQSNTVKKELPIVLLMTLIFAVLLLDNIFDPGAIANFSRQDGIVIVLAFSIFVYYLISMNRARKLVEEEKTDEKPQMRLLKALIFTVLGIAAIVVGSNLVVDSASKIAGIFGVSESMIALTIVALGTSLPELVTSIIATKKGEVDLALGNVVGSNIFNIGIVAGIPTAIFGGISQISFNIVDLAVMIFSAVFLYLFARDDRKISRLEGGILLVIFVIYYSYVVMNGLGVITSL